MQPFIQRPKNRTDLFKFTVGIASSLFVIWCLMESKEFLIPICVATLLAMLMSPIVEFLKVRKVPETAAATLAVAILYLPLIAIASLVIIEGDSLVKNWPAIYASAKTTLDHLMTTSMFGITPAHYVSIDEIQSNVTTRAGEGAVLLFAGLKTLLSAGTTTLLVLSFAAIMVYSRTQLRNAVDAIISSEENPDAARTLDGAIDVVQKFLIARVLIIVAVGIANFIILKLFGIPYAIMLAALLGLTTLVPVIGFFIGIIPPLIIALSIGHSVIFIGGLVAGIFAVSSAQDHVLTPALIGRKLNLNFLATYFAIFAGEQMWGLWGMFLSIPALGLLRVILASSETYKPWAGLLEEEGSSKTTEKIASAVKSENNYQPTVEAHI